MARSGGPAGSPREQWPAADRRRTSGCADGAAGCERRLVRPLEVNAGLHGGVAGAGAARGTASATCASGSRGEGLTPVLGTTAMYLRQRQQRQQGRGTATNAPRGRWRTSDGTRAPGRANGRPWSVCAFASGRGGRRAEAGVPRRTRLRSDTPIGHSRAQAGAPQLVHHDDLACPVGTRGRRATPGMYCVHGQPKAGRAPTLAGSAALWPSLASGRTPSGWRRIARTIPWTPRRCSPSLGYATRPSDRCFTTAAPPARRTPCACCCARRSTPPAAAAWRMASRSRHRPRTGSRPTARRLSVQATALRPAMRLQVERGITRSSRLRASCPRAAGSVALIRGLGLARVQPHQPHRIQRDQAKGSGIAPHPQPHPRRPQRGRHLREQRPHRTSETRRHDRTSRGMAETLSDPSLRTRFVPWRAPSHPAAVLTA